MLLSAAATAWPAEPTPSAATAAAAARTAASCVLRETVRDAKAQTVGRGRVRRDVVKVTIGAVKIRERDEAEQIDGSFVEARRRNLIVRKTSTAMTALGIAVAGSINGRSTDEKSPERIAAVGTVAY